MALADIEKQYDLMNEACELLQAKLQDDCLDALIENFDNLLNDGKVHVEDGIPDEKTASKLAEIYRAVRLDEISTEDRRLLLQLSLLTAYRKEKIQANHQMTPDSIGFLTAYLLQQVYEKKDETNFLDLCVGTGNLAAVVINSLKNNGFKNIHGFGIDNDDTLLTIASIESQLCDLDLNLYHQDALDKSLIPQADVIVSDLPVGWYPLDERAEGYETHAKEGHSFVHFLLIEQALDNLKEGGIGMFLIPSSMFESKESLPLLKFIQKNGYLQSLINLPGAMFASKKSEKAILILQKKGAKSKQANPVLLGEFPLVKDTKNFEKFMVEVAVWKEKNF